MVPLDLGRSIPPVVSGFWTARSGVRFATIVRSGERVSWLDREGELLRRS